MLPFEVSKHITLRGNQYILQVKVTNVSVNKVFPESFLFKCWRPEEFDLVDLNEKADGQAILERSIVFNPEEIRSFIFILKPKDPKILQINKFKSEQLGQLEINWYNYLGDPGILKVGPFKHGLDSN